MSRSSKLLAAQFIVGALVASAVIPAGATGGGATQSSTIAQVLIAKSSTAGFDGNNWDTTS